MRTVLIAGGSGFVGSHLCDALLADGDHVFALDNLISGSVSNVAHLKREARFVFVRHDIVKPLPRLPKFDVVINLACPAAPADYQRHPVETLRTSSEGTRHLLERAARDGAQFLHGSTSEIYGNPMEHPQKEGYWGYVNPYGPRSCYDEGKRYAESLIYAYRHTGGVQTKIVRIFNTYGPRMRYDDGRVVSSFVTQALRGKPLTVFGDGTQTRSFCYVSDMIDGLLRMLASDEEGPINLGNSSERTIQELADLTVALTGSRSGVVFRPLPADDPIRRRPDITLARQRLGWEPRVELEEGLRRTIDWFRATVEESTLSK